MDKATGEGTGLTGQTTFVASAANGTGEIEFTFGEGFAGKTLVVFERLYEADGTVVAVHEDIEDEEQTVYVNEQPEIATSATDQADGDKNIAWNGGTVVDVVSYENLVVGDDRKSVG